MQLMFKSRVRDAQPLRPWAQERVSFVLRRLAWRAQTATVRLEDVDGPRHGLDKRCSVAIQGSDTPAVLVSATARDWTTALNLALARAAQTWKRLLQRQRDSRRKARHFVREQDTALPRARSVRPAPHAVGPRAALHYPACAGRGRAGPRPEPQPTPGQREKPGASARRAENTLREQLSRDLEPTVKAVLRQPKTAPTPSDDLIGDLRGNLMEPPAGRGSRCHFNAKRVGAPPCAPALYRRNAPAPAPVSGASPAVGAADGGRATDAIARPRDRAWRAGRRPDPPSGHAATGNGTSD